jgi:hypothetical protein
MQFLFYLQHLIADFSRAQGTREITFRNPFPSGCGMAVKLILLVYPTGKLRKLGACRSFTAFGSVPCVAGRTPSNFHFPVFHDSVSMKQPEDANRMCIERPTGAGSSTHGPTGSTGLVFSNHHVGKFKALPTLKLPASGGSEIVANSDSKA